MKNELKLTFAYLAAVIGAGFASGNEAVYYFVRFGKISFFGILLTCVGFGLFSFMTVEFCRKNDTYSFEEFTSKLMPQKISAFIQTVTNIFMAVILGAMISAFSEMINYLFAFSKLYTSVVFSFFCFFIIMLPEKIVIGQSGYLGTFIVFLIISMCIYMINHRCTDAFSPALKNIFFSASYTSYNVVSACSLLCCGARLIKSKKQSSKLGLLSFAFSFASLLSVWIVISIYYGKINLGELPMLTLAARQGYLFGLLYATVMTASIFTTAVATGFGIKKSLQAKNLSKLTSALITISVGYLISSVGFSSIVSKLYNIAGVCTFLLPIYLFLNFANNADKRRFKEIK